MEIIDYAGGDASVAPWSFGGGTALMLQIDHRDSHDVDVFLDDPQVLGRLNPSTHGYTLALVPSAYETDGIRSLRIFFDGVGEIDFICCGNITSKPTQSMDVAGRLIEIETPGEILAKKIHYRGSYFQPRDIFDLVAATRIAGAEEMIRSLSEIRDACSIAKRTIENMDPAFASAIMEQLMNIRPDFQDIPHVGRQEAIDLLEEVIGTRL